jgi:fumarate reductase subunit C
MSFRLYLAQRLSALVMAPLVIGHIVMMIVAVQNGLTAQEILARTQGSVFWGAYYGLFVVAVSIHAAIGLRNIVSETFRWRGLGPDILVIAVAVGLAITGARAVVAVVA